MLYCKHNIVSEDIGIGSYECWGATGVDSRILLSCSECDMEVSKENASRVDGHAGIFQAENGKLYLWDACGGVVDEDYNEAPSSVCDEVNAWLKCAGA